MAVGTPFLMVGGLGGVFRMSPQAAGTAYAALPLGAAAGTLGLGALHGALGEQRTHVARAPPKRLGAQGCCGRPGMQGIWRQCHRPSCSGAKHVAPRIHATHSCASWNHHLKGHCTAC